MKIVSIISSFIKFYLKAKPAIGHGIHSPFVYWFSTKVLLESKSKQPDLSVLFKYRKALKTRTDKISIIDFGAGGEREKEYIRTVKRILVKSTASPKYIKLLHCIVKQFQPLSIIELGTSLGISTAAMAIAAPFAKIHTIEGSPEIALLAKGGFDKMCLKNIETYIGEFEALLPQVLPKLNLPFIAFIDGNHKYEPTVVYFELLLNYVNESSILIFDDIYWSDEMIQAWDYIRNHSKTIICIDIYRMGFVFFNQGVIKQNFLIRY